VGLFFRLDWWTLAAVAAVVHEFFFNIATDSLTVLCDNKCTGSDRFYVWSLIVDSVERRGMKVVHLNEYCV
jgi:hypothetical protein